MRLMGVPFGFESRRDEHTIYILSDDDPRNRIEDDRAKYESLLRKWQEWNTVKSSGCVPSREYCQTCFQEGICDNSCYILPVCGAPS